MPNDYATDYTAKEREAIADAFRDIEYVLERTDHSTPHRWKQAFAYEKRQRGDVYCARALMVQGFAAGCTDPNIPARQLHIISDGIQTATIIGAWWAHGADAGALAEMLRRCAAADAAWLQSRERAHARFRAAHG